MDIYESPEDREKRLKALNEKTRSRDAKAHVRAILELPVNDGRTFSVDDVKSASELSKLNTDIRTRILLAVANDASRGDIKAAEFLFKYAGYTPVAEAHVTMDLPQIIDDLALPPGEEEQIVERDPDRPRVRLIRTSDNKVLEIADEDFDFGENDNFIETDSKVVEQ